MQQRTDIQKYDPLYDVLRYYVDFAFKLSYQRVKYVGTENIPSDGAVIFAPNHTNGLQDALAILAIDHGPKVFVARADIFRNPKQRRILTFLKIMPILRKRDGVENLGRNDEIMEKASQVLEDKVPFCIMAEGTHRPKHSLLPLLKGIFRIALRADSHIGGRMPVYIVPVGVEYGNYYRFRSSLLVNVGKAFNVSEFRAANATLTEPELLTKLRAELSGRMQETILYVPDDGDYTPTLELCYILSEDRLRHRSRTRNSLYNRMLEDKNVVEQVSALKSSDPEEWASLRAKAQRCFDIRQRKRISAYSVARSWPRSSIFLKSLLLLVTLPLWLFSVAAASPILLTSWLVCRTLKDPSFRNSFRYVLTLVLHPLLILLWGAVFFCTLPSALLAALLWVLSFGSVIISNDYYKAARHLVSDLRLASDGELLGLISDIRRTFNRL